MKRYWDLNDTERAALTAEEIERDYIPVELMERGCLRPEAPVLEDEPDVPDVPKETWFRINYDGDRYGRSNLDVIFASAEDAKTVMAICGHVSSYDDHHQEVCAELRDPRIESVELSTAAAIAPVKVEIAKAKGVRDRNAKLLREHEEEIRKVKEETTAVWDNWHSCRKAEGYRERVRRTFDEYVELTNGDKEMARTFLGKTFSQGEINAALGAGDLSPTLLDTLRLVGALGEEGGTVDGGAELVSQLDSLAAIGLVEHEPKGDSGHLALITIKGIDVLEKKSDG